VQVEDLVTERTEKNATAPETAIDERALRRFTTELNRTIAPSAKLGLAVSGGPDSVALLLLAAAARPGMIEAATVDHGLRPESADEAKAVVAICEKLGVPHEILTVEWDEKPETGIQQKARIKRFKALGDWARKRGLDAIVTAHHADDQAETFLMRLARGTGVKGLGGIRPVRKVPGSDLELVRPLLKFPHSRLVDLCKAAGIETVDDPSNEDEKFERVRVRRLLADTDWLDSKRVARAATHLRHAEAALQWAANKEAADRVKVNGAAVTFDPSGLPDELRRRILRSIILRLRSEGKGFEVRGREMNTLLKALDRGRKASLRGVLCSGGSPWRFTKAPARQPRTAKAPDSTPA
jgi:tRNA(Ile)-lysidine synthase